MRRNRSDNPEPGSIQESESPQRDFSEYSGIDIIRRHIPVFRILYLTEILVPASDLDNIFSVYTEITCFHSPVLHRMPGRGKLVTEKSPTRIQQAKGLLERMGLGKDHWNKPVLKLSGGQQQRIAIARALMIPFDILLLDEAFQGLDATSRELACQLVLEHCKGKMLLAVTHHPQEAELLQAEIFTME